MERDNYEAMISGPTVQMPLDLLQAQSANRVREREDDRTWNEMVEDDLFRPIPRRLSAAEVEKAAQLGPSVWRDVFQALAVAALFIGGALVLGASAHVVQHGPRWQQLSLVTVYAVAVSVGIIWWRRRPRSFCDR